MASMFIMRRAQKCSILPVICGRQPYLLGQHQAASPNIRCSGVPHSGHVFTNSTAFAPSGRSDFSTPVICGMISPAFST